jgi:hypothetical protein
MMLIGDQHNRKSFVKGRKQMHSAGLEPATRNLEGCRSVPAELRMLKQQSESLTSKC